MKILLHIIYEHYLNCDSLNNKLSQMGIYQIFRGDIQLNLKRHDNNFQMIEKYFPKGYAVLNLNILIHDLDERII